MGSLIQLVLLAIATVVLPLGYALVCRWMTASDIPRPPRLAFFLLFGALGGWTLAFLFAPSGIAGLCIVALVIGAPIALFASSISLARRPERTRFHRFAMWAGFVYVLLPPLGMYVGLFIASLMGSLHD